VSRGNVFVGNNLGLLSSAKEVKISNVEATGPRYWQTSVEVI